MKALGAIVLLVGASLWAARPPETLTTGGRISGTVAGATWQAYMTTNSSLMGTGAAGLFATNIWAGEFGGQPWALHPVGNEQICVLSREVNGGTPSHTGYYAVMNHVLTADDPEVFGDMTLRAIPVPAVVSGQPAHLSWAPAVQDAGEGSATNIIGYNVFRSADGIYFSMINTALVTQLVFDDPIPNDQGYYYALGLVYRGTPPVSSAAPSANSAKTVIVDSDSDGIPDWWMLQYFGHATGQAGDLSRAQDDANGDGMSNLQEYLLGRNPVERENVWFSLVLPQA